MTSWWVRWRLKSPASRLFTQLFIQAQIKENIKAPRHWPLWGKLRVTGLCEGNSPVTDEFLAQKTSNAEDVGSLIATRHFLPQGIIRNTQCICLCSDSQMAYLLSDLGHIFYYSQCFLCESKVLLSSSTSVRIVKVIECIFEKVIKAIVAINAVYLSVRTSVGPSVPVNDVNSSKSNISMLSLSMIHGMWCHIQIPSWTSVNDINALQTLLFISHSYVAHTLVLSWTWSIYLRRNLYSLVHFLWKLLANPLSTTDGVWPRVLWTVSVVLSGSFSCQVLSRWEKIMVCKFNFLLHQFAKKIYEKS